jgi:hypothetical protein
MPIDHHLTIRVPKRLHQIVERIASKEQRSTAQVYRMLIQQGIDSLLNIDAKGAN